VLKDVTEAVEFTKEFAHPEHNDLICKVLIIEKLLEAKASAVDGQIELLAKLFSALLKASPPVMSAAEIQAGFLRSCNAVPDASLDAPSCPTLVAKLFVQLVVLECVQLDMLQAILVEPVRTRPARLPADCSLLWLLPGRVRCPSDCPVRGPPPYQWLWGARLLFARCGYACCRTWWSLVQLRRWSPRHSPH